MCNSQQWNSGGRETMAQSFITSFRFFWMLSDVLYKKKQKTGHVKVHHLFSEGLPTFKKNLHIHANFGLKTVQVTLTPVCDILINQNTD